MKKLTTFGTLLLIILSSCNFSSDREKDEAETAKCLKEKSKDLKYKSIDDAIADYDFVTARKYLTCYPNVSYCCPNNGMKKRHSGDNQYDSNQYIINLKKVTRAEIIYMLNNGEIKKAKNVAIESDMMDMYNEIYKNLIEDNVKLNNTDK
jgi:hypothetical protein